MKQNLALIGILLLVACNSKAPVTTNVVAKVYDYVLTQDELAKNVPKANTVVDSLKLTQDYIENWAKQKLLFRNAIVNLDNTDELESLVNKYKEELYVMYYKNALVNKKLDTLVFNKEIESYYQSHKENFKLNETLIKFKYIHINSENKNKLEIKKLFVSDSIGAKRKIQNDYSGYDDYFLRDSVWVSLNNVYSKKINFPTLNKRDLRITKKFIEKKKEDKSLYYICINDILRDGDIAPLDYVKPTIKNILLQKNKLKFFDQMEQILIDDAVKQDKYEIR